MSTTLVITIFWHFDLPIRSKRNARRRCILFFSKSKDSANISTYEQVMTHSDVRI